MFEVEYTEYKKNIKVSFHAIKVVFSRYITINGNRHEVIGIGKATCDFNDKFNENFGTKLAEKRAWVNLLKMEEEFLVDTTKQPEWRKEQKQKEHHFIRESGYLRCTQCGDRYLIYAGEDYCKG